MEIFSEIALLIVSNDLDTILLISNVCFQEKIYLKSVELELNTCKYSVNPL